MEPIALSGLAPALGIGDRSHVALVGGGGKTTLLHALGDRLRGRVVLTTTTKMSSADHRGRPVLLDPTDRDVVAAATLGPVVVWTRLEGDKAIGIAPSRCDAWFAAADHVIVEADGSRGRPFKAPGPFEPVVPSTSTSVVSVIGADALGRVIADQCHRPLRVAALAGCEVGRRLDPHLAARVILHPDGLARSVPAGARLTVAITKVDDRTAQLVDQLIDELRAIDPVGRVVPIERSI